MRIALYDPARPQGPITAALWWAHARRQFFELADIATNARRGKNASAISPIAPEALKRIDALFDIERGINGQSAEERLRVRREQSAPLLAELEAWLREQRACLSSSASVAEPIDYMLRRWERFARFINDGRICLTNNAAERDLRGFALGRNKARKLANSKPPPRREIDSRSMAWLAFNDQLFNSCKHVMGGLAY
jgi:transposase